MTIQEEGVREVGARARFFAVSLSMVLGLSAAPGCEKQHSYHGEEPETPAAIELAGTNWDGEPFTLEELRGKLVFVFFGYTFCPDVCPFTLAKMKQLEARLGERAGEVEVVFVSVDPKRDSVEKLAGYVPNFDRGFYGLRLDEEQMEAATESFSLAVQFGQPKDGPGTDSFYYVDHTGTYFLLDREGRLRLRYPPNVKVDDLLPDVEALLDA